MGGPPGLYVVTKPQSPSLGSPDADQLMRKIDWHLQVLMGEVWAMSENVHVSLSSTCHLLELSHMQEKWEDKKSKIS